MRQRLFESKQTGYKEVLKQEKNRRGISKLKLELSKFDRHTTDPVKYKEFLLKKRRIDELVSPFYRYKK